MSEISGNVMFVLLNANVQHLVVIVILFPFHYKQLLFHQLVYKNHDYINTQMPEVLYRIGVLTVWERWVR